MVANLSLYTCGLGRGEKDCRPVCAGKTGLINGVVIGQRGLSREGPLYNIVVNRIVNYK